MGNRFCESRPADLRILIWLTGIILSLLIETISTLLTEQVREDAGGGLHVMGLSVCELGRLCVFSSLALTVAISAECQKLQEEAGVAF